MKRITILLTGILVGLTASAQDEIGEPTFVPSVKVGKTLVDGDSIQYMEINH